MLTRARLMRHARAADGGGRVVAVAATRARTAVLVTAFHTLTPLCPRCPMRGVRVLCVGQLR